MELGEYPTGEKHEIGLKEILVVLGVVAAGGTTYRQYMVDEYNPSNKKIKETKCVDTDGNGNIECRQEELSCVDNLYYKFVDTSKITGNIPAIPANTKSYYCDSGGLGGSGGGGGVVDAQPAEPLLSVSENASRASRLSVRYESSL